MIAGIPGTFQVCRGNKLAFQKFLGPQTTPGITYIDNSKELEKACADLGYLQDTSRPHRPQTNCVAARAVRRVKEGTSAALIQSGLASMWWPTAMMCYCMLRNIVDMQAARVSEDHSKQHPAETSWERRFNQPFDGPAIPLGAEVKYKPSAPNGEKRLHQFGDKLLPGLFAGYHQKPGGTWAGDLYIIDQDEIAQTNTHPSNTQAYSPQGSVYPKTQRPLSLSICNRKTHTTRLGTTRKETTQATTTRVQRTHGTTSCRTGTGNKLDYAEKHKTIRDTI